MSPRLTVILPTRERHDTLIWALKTCVTQDCDDLEILVSDNASVDETREVVASYDDPRIRYVNTGKRVSMSQNWEFAVSHVQGGHLGIIGDDDGLMPGAAAEMVSLLVEQPTEALIWPVFNYYWPGYVDSAIANCLTMRLHQPLAVSTVDAPATLRAVCDFEEHPHRLPSLYWGLVSRDAVTRATSADGRFFHSITPDIYSGLAVASVLETYTEVSRAMTLSGESRHSNGAAQITGAGEASASSASSVFLAENQRRFHPELDYASNIDVLLAEALLQVRDHVPQGSTPPLDVARLVSSAVRHPDHLFNPLVRPGVERSLSSIAERHGLGDHAREELRRGQRRHTARLLGAGLGNVLQGAPLFDGTEAGVENIYGATLFADRLRAGHRPAVRMRELRGRAAKARRAVRAVRGRGRTPA